MLPSSNCVLSRSLAEKMSIILKSARKCPVRNDDKFIFISFSLYQQPTYIFVSREKLYVQDSLSILNRSTLISNGENGFKIIDFDTFSMSEKIAEILSSKSNYFTAKCIKSVSYKFSLNCLEEMAQKL